MDNDELRLLDQGQQLRPVFHQSNQQQPTNNSRDNAASEKTAKLLIAVKHNRININLTDPLKLIYIWKRISKNLFPSKRFYLCFL